MILSFLDIDRYASLEHTQCANTLMFIKKFQSFNVPSAESSEIVCSGLQKHKITLIQFKKIYT